MAADVHESAVALFKDLATSLATAVVNTSHERMKICETRWLPADP